MLALLNWRIWLAICLAVTLALIGAGGYRAGKRHTQAAWDAEKVVQLNAASQAEAQNRKIENQRQMEVINAQNAQAKRTAVLQADVASSRATVDSLRDTIRAATSSLPRLTPAAAGEYTAAAGQLLTECSANYAEVARQADGHASDSLMLQQAWPK